MNIAAQEKIVEIVTEMATQPPSLIEIGLDQIQVICERNRGIITEITTNIVDSFIKYLTLNKGRLDKDNIDIYIARLNATIEIEFSDLSLNIDGNIDLIPRFQLNADDKSRMLELCEQIRQIILASDAFDHPHRIRLSDRVAAVEAEIHKDKGMFDVVLGMVSDVGETLGKFGKDIKPLTDRVNEVLKIARANTEEYKQLPAPEEVAKGLPAPDESEVTSDEG